MTNRFSGTKPHEIIADCSLLFVALTWGSTYVIVKATLETIPVFSFIFMRYALATLCLLCFNLSNLNKIHKRLVLDSLILGAVLFIGYSFQTLGLRQTPAPIMAFTTNLYVVIVPFLQGLVLKIRPRVEALFGVSLAVIGLAFITLKGQLMITVGILFGIGCAFFYALHIILVDRYSKRNNSNLLTFLQLAFVAVFSVIASGLYEPYIWPDAFDNQLILALAITGILGTSLAFFIMISMQKHTTPTKAAIIYMMESPSSVIFNYLLLGQLLTMRQSIGVFFIFLSMIAANFGAFF